MSARSSAGLSFCAACARWLRVCFSSGRSSASVRRRLGNLPNQLAPGPLEPCVRTDERHLADVSAAAIWTAQARQPLDDQAIFPLVVAAFPPSGVNTWGAA